MAKPQAPIPPAVRLVLGRAAVQSIADRTAVDVLHIKGNAVHANVRTVAQPGTDIDVLARPSDIPRLDTSLRSLGWTVYSTFAFGSPFEHAQTYWHDVWGYLDLHRLFPGIEVDPALAFDILWAERSTHDFGGVACPVPAPLAQTVILLLNCARNPRPGDLATLWTDAAPAKRLEVQGLVDRLHAEVAFAAATGDLDRMRGRRTHPLWHIVVNGGTRAAEWSARVRAAPTPAAALRIAMRAPMVNVDALAHRLGRHPTRDEIVREFLTRPVTAMQQFRHRRRRPT